MAYLGKKPKKAKPKAVPPPLPPKVKPVMQSGPLASSSQGRCKVFVIAANDPYIDGVKRFIAKRNGKVTVTADGDLELSCSKDNLPAIDNYLMRANGDEVNFNRVLKIRNEIEPNVKE